MNIISLGKESLSVNAITKEKKILFEYRSTWFGIISGIPTIPSTAAEANDFEAVYYVHYKNDLVLSKNMGELIKWLDTKIDEEVKEQVRDKDIQQSQEK